MDEKLQKLIDKMEIEDLITNFAQGADNPDRELQLSVFSPDVRLEFDGMEPIDGLEAFIAAQKSGAFKGVTRCEMSWCTHAMVNRRISVNGDDKATGIVHAISVLVGTRSGKPYSAIRGLYYEDKYRRIEGRWYISFRRHTLRWLIEGENAHLPDGCRLAASQHRHPWG